MHPIVNGVCIGLAIGGLVLLGQCMGSSAHSLRPNAAVTFFEMATDHQGTCSAVHEGLLLFPDAALCQRGRDIFFCKVNELDGPTCTLVFHPESK